MKLRKIVLCLVVSLGAFALNPQKAEAQSKIDLLIEGFQFRFRPDALQDRASNTGYVQGLYEKTPDFALWLLMDMGGDLLVDEDHFELESSTKDNDGIWMLNAVCHDEVNGSFGLHFAIDSKSGEAALKLSDAEEDLALYSGKIMPYEDPAPEFRNAKKEAEGLEMEQRLNVLIPNKNFSIKLASELYGQKSIVTVKPDKLYTNAPMILESEDFEVICLERQADTWYIRFGLNSAFSEISDNNEEMFLDLAINAYTGDTNYRVGLADRLKPSWRSITDGKVELKN